MRERPGIFFSAGGHAAALVIGLVAFSSPKPHEMPEDSIPVDVISAEEFTQLTKGSKVAPKAAQPKKIVDRQAPEEKVVEDPTPKVDKTEIKTASAPPPVPEPRPAPPEPAPVAPPVPQPTPAPPEARRRPDPEPDPPKPEPKPQPVAKPAPAPEPKRKPEPTLEDKLAELAKEPPKADKKPAPKPEPKHETKKPEHKPEKPVKVAEAKPAPAPKPAPAKPAPAAHPAHANPEKSFNPADIRALLDKRTPARPEATGTTPPSRTATLGSPVGTAPRLSQSEIDALRAQIQQCWNPLTGAGAETLIVKIRIGLGPDGALNAQPQIVNRGTGAFQAAADAAIRAVRRCAPYKLPAAKYDAWKDVEITFDPRDMLRG